MKSEIDTTGLAIAMAAWYVGANTPVKGEDNQLSFLWDEQGHCGFYLNALISRTMNALEIPVTQRYSVRIELNRRLSDKGNFGSFYCIVGNIEDYLHELTQGESYSCF